VKQQYAHNTSIFLLDMATSVAASVFAALLTRALMGEILGFSKIIGIWVAVSIVASAICFATTGSYKIVIRHSTLKSINKYFIAAVIKEAILALVIVCGLYRAFGIQANAPQYFTLIFDFMLTLMSLILIRVAIINGYDSAGRSYADQVEKISVIVYGTSNKAIATVTRLTTSPNYNIIGFLSPEKSHNGQIIHDLKVWSYENEADVVDLRNKLGFECILFADHDELEQEKQDALSMICLHNGIHVLNAPKIAEAKFGGLSQEAIKEVANTEMVIDGMSGFGRITKRLVDCGLSGMLLIVFSPLFLICFLAIKLSDRGPAIYKQERIGRFGRPFNIYKFRSMRTDAEAAGPALYSGDDDPRLTKVGKFLRQHHLDELPQLWNVFIGDMAFIGWRPERKFYIDQIMEHDPRYYYLYQIRPGVTSYSTLKNGYTDTMEKMLRRLEFDLYYLRHRSWWFDIKILFATFMNIVFGKKF